MENITLQNKTWNEIVQEHYEKNFHKLTTRLQHSAGGIHQAEDIVQDSYERALKYGNSFSGDKFESWFSTILRNAARDYKRAEKGFSDSIEIDEYDHIGSYCPGYSNKIWDELEILIDTKNPSHAEVLRLFFLKGYSYKDISAVTEHSYFNAYRIVERFKEELERKYKGK